MSDLPIMALSVRQPWAWAIIHGGKDIENRSLFAVTKGGLKRTGRVAIHASKGMTRYEYDHARQFMDSLGVYCPAPCDLSRGGLIGSVDVAGVVKTSNSSWFFGPCGLVLRDPRACAFVPAIGALGYFEWRPDYTLIPPAPAKWMMPGASSDKAAAASPQLDLL